MYRSLSPIMQALLHLLLQPRQLAVRVREQTEVLMVFRYLNDRELEVFHRVHSLGEEFLVLWMILLEKGWWPQLRNAGKKKWSDGPYESEEMICAASICTAISELSSFKHPTRLLWKQMSTITVSERILRTNAWRNEKLLARASFAVGFPMTLFLCRFKVVMSMAITASDTAQCQRYRD